MCFFLLCRCGVCCCYADGSLVKRIYQFNFYGWHSLRSVHTQRAVAQVAKGQGGEEAKGRRGVQARKTVWEKG